jgi:hypothetical protein
LIHDEGNTRENLEGNCSRRAFSEEETHMITVRVCDTARKTFDRFVEQDGTTTFVSVPQGTIPQMLAFAMKPGFHACIEVDGEEVSCVALDEPATPIDVPAASKPSGAGSLLRNLIGGSRSQNRNPFPSEMTVLVRRDSAGGQVVGTFKFHLLDPVSYAATLEQKLQESAARSTTPPVVYTNDHHLPGTVPACWNCSTPLAGDCCNNCGHCQDHQTQ